MKKSILTYLIIGLIASSCATQKSVFSKVTDIFIPAAREGTVNEENQGKLNTKIVCEGANGPLTSRADEELTKKGVLIIPDL